MIYHSDPSAAGEGFAPGWQGTAFAEFRLARSRVGLRMDGTYGRNDANAQRRADLMAAFGMPVDEMTRLLSANAAVTFEFWSSHDLKAYLLVGMGLYNVKLSMTSSSFALDTTLTKVGWNAGWGVRSTVGAAVLFLEARYCRVSRVLDEGRYYKGTFYHTYGIQVQQFGLTAGIHFGRE